MEASAKPTTYGPDEVEAKLKEARTRRLVPRGRLDPPQVQHRRLADDAHGRQRRRLRLRGGLPPRRPRGDLGQAVGQADEPRRRRHHRQGLRGGAADRGHGAVAARRTTARSRGPRTSSCSARAAARPWRRAARAMADRYLFVTGKLAAPALRETLRRAELPFDYDVAVMKITVAALMTPDWIARRLEVPPERHADHDPGPVPGRRRRCSASGSTSRPRRAPPTSSACRRSSARPTRARATARATSASSPRSTTSRTSTASGSSRRRATTATPAPTSSTSGSRSTATGSRRGRR